MEYTDQQLEQINIELQAKPRTFLTYADLLVEAETEQLTGLSSKVLSRTEQSEIRELVGKTLAYSESPENMVLKFTKIVDIALSNTSLKGLARIKTLKAELNKQLYQMVGADTGYYKSDYMVYMTAKKDSVMGSFLTQMEQQVTRLAEYIKSTEI